MERGGGAEEEEARKMFSVFSLLGACWQGLKAGLEESFPRAISSFPLLPPSAAFSRGEKRAPRGTQRYFSSASGS